MITREEIENEILPVSVMPVSTPLDHNKSRTLYYLIANNGFALTNALPGRYLGFIRDLFDRAPVSLDPETRKRKLLLTVEIPEEPLDRRDGKTIIQHEDGRFSINASGEYQAMLARAKKNSRKRLFRAKCPLTGPVQVTAHFYVNPQYRRRLGDLLATAIDILYDLGVFHPQSYNIVMSVDGSAMHLTADPSQWKTVIYVREWSEEEDGRS